MECDEFVRVMSDVGSRARPRGTPNHEFRWRPSTHSIPEDLTSFQRREKSMQPAPQLLFDDGSRVMHESIPVNVTNRRTAARNAISVVEYYEMDRVVREIQSLDRYDRVALQFPDELLQDAPQVCWEMETRLKQSLVFVLGDTTYASCCPDQVAAAHLQADCLVHYGHACLSPCHQIPVIYCFGRDHVDTEDLTRQMVQTTNTEQNQRNCQERKVMLLYQVQYHHAIDNVQKSLRKNGFDVELATLPERATQPKAPETSNLTCESPNCCSSDVIPSMLPCHVTLDESKHPSFVVGGLQFPDVQDLSQFTVLYIGDPQSRQYLNIVMRMISISTTSELWTYNPQIKVLSKNLSPAFQKKLNRRFFLIQKARHLSRIGILVSNLSDTYLRQVVLSLRILLEERGLSTYTVVVGKINPAKLANFAEIEAFCLVACPEHSLLDEERDFPVPVLTPLEISMAMDLSEWGATAYSLDTQDFLRTMKDFHSEADKQDTLNDTEADAPYFSLVTGRYESRPGSKVDNGINLHALPGQGTLTKYTSAASDFLQSREYQGLIVAAGETEVKAAVKGHTGIPSNYGER